MKNIEKEIKEDEKRLKILRENPVATTQYEFITVADGTKIFLRYFTPLNTEEKAMLICLHGLGAHSAYWTILADFLLPKGIYLYVPDMRSHGRTEAKIGHLDNFDIVFSDIREIIEYIKKKNPRLPLFMLGESMGGAIAINYVSRFPQNIDGLILSAPAIKAVNTNIIQSLFNLPSYLFHLAFLPEKLVFKLTGEEELGSRDPGQQNYDSTDPAHLQKTSMRFMINLAKIVRNTLKEAVNKINLPIIIFQGSGDKVISEKGAKEFYEKLPARDKTLKIFNGSYHCLMTDPASKDEIREIIYQWMIERI